MRLINLVVQTWVFRQKWVDLYQRSMPSTKQDQRELERLASLCDDPSKPIVVSNEPKTPNDTLPPAVYAGATETYADRNDDGETIPSLPPDAPLSVDQVAAIARAKHRHPGITAWDLMLMRLKDAGIELETDEYAGLDPNYVECVAELTAELRIEGLLDENGLPTCAIAHDRPWIVEIEKLKDNEAMCEAIRLELMAMNREVVIEPRGMPAIGHEEAVPLDALLKPVAVHQETGAER